LRRRKDDSEIVELDVEEDEQKRKKKKIITLDGTKNIRDLFQKDKKGKSKDKVGRDESILLRPEPLRVPHEIQEPTLFPSQPSKYGKMEMSLLNFKNSYPKWTPKGDSKQQIENFLDNITAIRPPTAPLAPRFATPLPPIDMNTSWSSSVHDNLSSSIYMGDYSTIALMRDVELEETQKENMQRSLILFSTNRIMTRQEQSKLPDPSFV